MDGTKSNEVQTHVEVTVFVNKTFKKDYKDVVLFIMNNDKRASTYRLVRSNLSSPRAVK